MGESHFSEDGVWLRDAVTSMHSAATQRMHLLEDLARLCKALASDVKHICLREKVKGLEEELNFEEYSLSALETLRQLKQKSFQKGVDGDRRHAIFSRYDTSSTSECVGSSPESAGFPLAGGNSRSDGNCLTEVSRANVDSYLNKEPFLCLSGQVSSSKGEKNDLLIDVIHRRDALRDEVASLKTENERLALYQDHLKRSVHFSAHAAAVVGMERDVFTALSELFSALLETSEDWLTSLRTSEISSETRQENNDAFSDTVSLQSTEEEELRGKIRQHWEAQREAVMARRAATMWAQSTRVVMATLRQELHEMQMNYKRQRDEGYQQQLLWLRLEAAVMNAESKYLNLRLQYVRRFMSVFHHASSDGNDDDDDFARELPSDAASQRDRMNRAFMRLRSIVVNYEMDLCKLKQIKRLLKRSTPAGSFSRGEQMFKEKHQEIKTAILPCLASSEGKDAFHSGVQRIMPWPLKMSRLKSSFPSHCVESVHSALLALIVLWEHFTPVEQQRVCAAIGDMAVNAHLLLMIAKYVKSRRRRR
ncbi:hypothetical protein C3747_14g195 [Trypanosoma cruzi]|uniref:Uncharacterized protein n=2 Tax=Trypanosoma cruzi TaxID=5693 RepID=Q4DXK0_TRYCC|nr:hypothetical protein Tc00.1047053506195.260 [Trypanosoma cruzi]EAN97268.1 hypothetical protein Tc00.1047053506195.260 [Trypanosoma cruzi]PWV18320.1 hypothetical protein C3747_14g195 [Trypanosoma cruzi]RNC45981.1 hypothetical protein TcCL_NonESM04207 [Trypanosoma cruzi]|eukprot:XP_819119.1 hypothetical protein [Trypanosoma cruzi strain CL Brener]